MISCQAVKFNNLTEKIRVGKVEVQFTKGLKASTVFI